MLWVAGSQSSATHVVNKNINIHDKTTEYNAEQRDHRDTSLGVQVQGHALKFSFKSQHRGYSDQGGPNLFFPRAKNIVFPLGLKFQKPFWHCFWKLITSFSNHSNNYLEPKLLQCMFQYTDWGCLRTGCWGEYLDLRGMKERENGESCTMGSFIICTHHQILLGRSNEGEWGGRGMWHAWEREETCKGFWRESLREINHLKDKGIDGKMGQMDLRGIVWGCGVDSPGSWEGPVEDSCECGDVLRVLAPQS
jgi:hypothetical protein